MSALAASELTLLKCSEREPSGRRIDLEAAETVDEGAETHAAAGEGRGQQSISDDSQK